MNKGERFIVIFAALIVLSAGLSIADFTPKGNTIATQYSAGDTIRGTINISFTSESADSLFESNFEGNITLIDLLKANNLVEGTDYNCSYPKCFDSYTLHERITGNIGLTSDLPLFVGFKITGEDVSISSLKFSITSSANKSCQRQILIDVLNKDEAFIQPTKNSGEPCELESYGCFNPSASSIKPVSITNSPLCEKINLTSAPGYRIGAYIENGTKPSTLEMSLETLPGREIREECTLNLTQAEGIVWCNVNHSSTYEGEYLVCVYSDRNQGDSGYPQIRSENNLPICGEGERDFEIFAQPLKFAPVETINVNNSVFSKQNFGQDLVDYANEYLEENYGGNCSEECFIPFKITGIPQTLTFGDIGVVYSDAEGYDFPEDRLYELQLKKASITTPKYVNLEMSHAGFKIPVGSTANRLSISLDGKTITGIKNLPITILPSFAFDIYPKNVSFGALTTFQALTPVNITSSVWKFGDGTTRATTGKTISHRYTTYNSQGYTLEVDLVRKDGVLARSSFHVSIGNLRESANRLLSEYDAGIANLSSKINSFSSISPFISSNLRARFNITSMQNSLNATRKMLGNASDIDVITSILDINLPASLEVSEEGNNIPLEFGFGNMNVGYIRQISGASASSDEDLKKAIASWFDKNYDSNINYETISRTNDDGGKTPVLTDFRVSINKKTGADESANNAYLIINYPKESISFAGNYSEKTVGSGTYVPITGSTTIEFIVNGGLGVSTLGMYISPTLDKLSSYGVVEIIEKEGFNWGKFILWVLILLVFASAIYAVLQQWYKKRYESYLFKNPADLYNLINFIHNSRKAGISDGETGEKLRKAKWKGEQIAYAFRKIDGKRTGMPELPFFRFFEKRKIAKEIEKRKQPLPEQPAQSKQNIY